jgi:hypothetical protein
MWSVERRQPIGLESVQTSVISLHMSFAHLCTNAIGYLLFPVMEATQLVLIIVCDLSAGNDCVKDRGRHTASHCARIGTAQDISGPRPQGKLQS